MKSDAKSGLFSLFIAALILSGCDKKDYPDTVYGLNPWVEYGSMTDQDGNIYKTILIGNQTWMAKNLKTLKLNDGTPISVVSDTAAWYNLTTPGCCWQKNDPIRKTTYGVLYNWYTVKTGKLCPKGWHVPDDTEWTILTDYLGGPNIAGASLKETGFRHWISPNEGASDASHFSAFPGGERLDGPDALFEGLGEAGYWWSGTSENEWAVSRILVYNSTHIQKFFSPKKRGLSVRCVWDY